MAVSNRFILEQGAVLQALGKAAIGAVKQRVLGVSKTPPTVPGPVLRQTFPPRSAELVRTYVRHVGGDPSAYRDRLPPHLFPQWGFGLTSGTLQGLPYPLTRVMNGGCRLEINGPLPANEPLEVTAQLVEIDDNGRRAVLHQRIVTSTASAPEALVATLFAIVPLGGGKKDKKDKKDKKPKARVPLDAQEIAFWHLRPDAGLDFAKLTGDFNPIHWVPSYARASGFRNTILHGFSTMARAMEGLRRHHKGTTPIATFDVKFTRPLVLPARVGLYIDNLDSIFVGDAPGGPAYMTGHFTTVS